MLSSPAIFAELSSPSFTLSAWYLEPSRRSYRVIDLSVSSRLRLYHDGLTLLIPIGANKIGAAILCPKSSVVVSLAVVSTNIRGTILHR
jgi:hypothetical protein